MGERIRKRLPLDVAKESLPELNLKELQELKKNIDFYISKFATKHDSLMDTDAISIFYSALMQAIMKANGNHISSYPDWRVFRKGKNEKLINKLDESRQIMEDWFKRAFGRPLNRDETRTMFHIAFGLFAQSLKRMQVEVSMMSMLNQAGRVGALFEDMFPGYASSGLINLLVLKRP